MKTILPRRLLTLAASVALGLTASAQSLYWDSDGTGAGNDCGTGAGLGGSGTWDTISSLWALDSNCAGGDTTFTSGSAVNFSGTAGTVNMTGPITVGNMTYGTAGYVISNNANFAANTLTLNSGATITVPSGTVTNVSVINGTGGYTLTGGGTLYLPSTNNITGPITVTGGSTLRIRESFAIGGNTGDVTLDGATLQADDNGTIDTSLNLFPGGATGKNLVIGASGGTIDFANTGGGTQLFAWGGAGTHILGTGPLLISASGGAKESFRVTVSGNTFSKLVLKGPICYQTSSGTASDDTVLGALPGTFTPDAIVISNNAVLMFNASPTIQANRGITIGSGPGDNACIGFAVASSAGSINSVITGPGNLNIQNSNGGYLNGSSGGLVNLNAANTYTGSTIVNGGIVVANAVGAIPHTPLIFNPSGATSWTSSRALIVTANQTVPSLSSGPTAGATSTIRMQNNAIMTVGDDNSSTAFAGIVSSSTGSGTFVKTGSGTLTISNKWTLAQNANQGHVIITNGTIKFGNSTAGLPSQVTTAGAAMTHIASGATLDAATFGATLAALEGAGNIINAGNITFDGTNATGAAVFTGNITGANGGNHTGAGTQTLSGVNTFANFTNSSGRINFNSQGAPGIGNIRVTGSSTLASTATVTVTNPVIINANTVAMKVASSSGNVLTLSGIVSGAGALIRDNADVGTVVLSGNNTYTGGTLITNSLTLSIAHNNALGTGTLTNGGGILENAAGSDLTIANNVTLNGGFTYGGTNNSLTINGAVLVNGATRTITVNGNVLTLGVVNQDAASRGITKQGAGKLVLTGTSTYTGNTTVTTGTLQVDGNISTSPTTTVSTGATLKGNGTVAAVTLNNGSTVAPGASVGTLNTANLTLNSGSSYQWEFSDANGAAGTGYDTINATGALSIGATSANPCTIKITGTPANFPGSGSWTLVSAASVSGFDYRSFAIDTSGLTATLDPNKAFRVTVSGNNLVLTYADPAITADPANIIVSHTSNAVFTVVATGASVSYQWSKGATPLSNGGNVAGATSSALTIQNVADSDVESYTVVVTDSTIPASVTSASATLDIADAPVVTLQPASKTVGLGTNTSFVFSWNGAADDIAKGITTFRWKTNGVNVSNGAKYSGVTTTNLTITGAANADAASYTCVLTNQFGSATASAVLGVDAVPTISVQPTDITIAPYGGFESNNTKVVAAGGDLSYQWYQGTPSVTNTLVEDPNNLVGVTTAQLLITNAIDTNSGSYFVIITNYAGSITSALATISVPVDPVVSVNPVSQSAVTGTNVVFTTVTSGKPVLFYHWKKDGVNLIDDAHVNGANTPSLTLLSVTTGDTANTPGYTLEVTNAFNITNSTPATLTVFDPAVFTGTYADGVLGGRTYTNGNQINLTAPVSQGTSLTYQWKKGSANVQNGANIVGSQTSALTILSAVLTNQGSYKLVANNYAGSVTSSPPAVVVINQPVVITVQPSSVTIDNAGKSYTFNVVATGNPLAYQWYFNSNAIPGATSASYTIPTVSSANIGYYHVVVSNVMNSDTSIEVTLKIGNATFFSDDLTTDTSANWNVYTNRTDGVAAFAFDYSLRNDNSGPGIPQNPNTSTPKALYLAINYAPTTQPDSITLTPTAINATGDYELSFDVFMNYLGNALGAQTAQSMTAGLGCSSATTNGTGALTNGVVVSANCDDQAGADFVMYRNTGAAVASAAAANNAFNATGSFPTKHINSYYSFLTGGNQAAWPATESQSTLPGAGNQTGLQDIGTFGLAWHHCVIKRFGNGTGTTNTTWYIDGVAIGTVTNAYYAPDAGSISLGLWANFAGGGSSNWQFTLFNNVRVENFSGSGVAPTVVTPFSGATASAGSTATLSVVATSPTAMHYQWFKNGSTITDATNSTYSITNVLATHAGTYSVTVYNESTFVDGGSGILTVGDPGIVTQPASATVECGSDATLSVVAGGTGTLTYQWYTPDTTGTAISGATASSLTIGNVSGTNSYAVVVTGTYGTATSATATVSAIDTTGPVITINGSNPDTACQTVSYVDPGATANDACEGPVGVVTSGSVDTSTLGDYTLTYTATDLAGNSSSATRVVHVQFCTPVAITSLVSFPASTLKVPEGTNVVLSVSATGADPKTYQWYLEGNPIPGATSTNYSFTALRTPTTNHHYSITVSNGVNSVSSNRLVTVLVDPKGPVLTLTSPGVKKVYNAGTFLLAGKAVDDAKGNIAHVYYYYINSNTFNVSPTYEALPLAQPGVSQATKTFSIATNPPPLPGTNVVACWPVDLAGNIGKGTTNVFFYQIPIAFTLHKLGDGTGSVTFKDKLGDKVNTSNVVYFLAGDIDKTVNLNVGETYTLSYTPDRTTNNIKNLPSVVSVLSNAPGMDASAGTNTIKKYIGPDILVESNLTSVSFEFDRDRFNDMAGNYNAVFTGDVNNPTVASSRYLHMTVTKTRLVSGYLKDSIGTKDIFTPTTPGAVFTANGHLHLTTPGGITLDGVLAWSGSDDTTGVKQFTGSASNNTFSASVVADKEDGLAFADGLATMSIPGMNNNPGGSGFATLKAKNGNVTAGYLLGDDDKHGTSWPMKASRSGNLPQWVVTKTGVLFGTLNGTNAASLTAPSLSWIRNTTFLPYPNVLPSGFVNSPFAGICSAYDGTGLTGSFTVTLAGGNLTNTITAPNITLAGILPNKYTSLTGPVTLASVDLNGKLVVTFLDGGPNKHKTTGFGVVLQNTTNGAGFFLRNVPTQSPTNSGSITLTPQ